MTVRLHHSTLLGTLLANLHYVKLDLLLFLSPITTDVHYRSGYPHRYRLSLLPPP